MDLWQAFLDKGWSMTQQSASLPRKLCRDAEPRNAGSVGAPQPGEAERRGWLFQRRPMPMICWCVLMFWCVFLGGEHQYNSTCLVVQSSSWTCFFSTSKSETQTLWDQRCTWKQHVSCSEALFLLRSHPFILSTLPANSSETAWVFPGYILDLPPPGPRMLARHPLPKTI